jgi:taurine dioxygenase/putative 2-oxoglutarate oxygenase
MQLRPLCDAIGTEVLEIDISEPVPAATFDRLYKAWLDTSVLLFRDQQITPAQQVAFTRRFGEIVAYNDPTENPLPEQPEILLLTNLTKEGKPSGKASSAYLWHSDGHYLREPPSGSMLYAVEVPPVGGDTWFANTAAAYETLPDAMKQGLKGLSVIISRVQSRPYNFPHKPPVTPEQRAAWPDMPQPLVRTHPESGRKALYIGSNVPWRIVGMPDEESAPLITELQKLSIQPQFTYQHVWRAGDALLWDNVTSMHRATPFDVGNHRRIMHRTTIAGGVPF